MPIREESKHETANIIPIRDRTIPEVTELLKAYLGAQQQFPFSIVGVVMVGYGRTKDGVEKNMVCADWAGEGRLEPALTDAFDFLGTRIKRSISSWALPPEDDSLDASHVAYNVTIDPLGFDFIIWLVAMEMRRIRLKGAAPLKVGFWMGFDHTRHAAPDRELWLENVFRPALPLIGAVEKPLACHGHRTNVFVPGIVVEPALKGEKVPTLRSMINHTLHPGAVTITLRECSTWTHRNSNLRAWIDFANYLRLQGEKVVIVRDHAKADEPLEDFVTCPMASKNLDMRMALYESAKCNLFVANGPGALALFSTRPWMMFIPIEDDDAKYHVNTRQFWHKHMGIEMGEQYPWSKPDQRIVWKKDDYENLIEAWQGTHYTVEQDDDLRQAI